jgi:hypothetical protein
MPPHIARQQLTSHILASQVLSANATYRVPNNFSFYDDEPYFLSMVYSTSSNRLMNGLCTVNTPNITNGTTTLKVELEGLNTSSDRKMTREEELMHERQRSHNIGITTFQIHEP